MSGNRVLTFGNQTAVSLAVMKQETNMHQACDSQDLAEPKYFLLWVVVWIVALAIFLPVLR